MTEFMLTFFGDSVSFSWSIFRFGVLGVFFSLLGWAATLWLRWFMSSIDEDNYQVHV